MRILSIYKIPSVLPQSGNPAPSRGSQPSLSLRDISPRGRDKIGWRVRENKTPKPKNLGFGVVKFRFFQHLLGLFRLGSGSL